MAIWTRLFRPSLISNRDTWALTVAALRNSVSAISALDRPRPISTATSRSRLITWDCELGYTVGGKKTKVSILILVDSMACYQALDGEHRDATIKDASN